MEPSPAALVFASSSSACTLRVLRPNSSLDSSARICLLPWRCSWILEVRPWRDVGVCMRLRSRSIFSLIRVILSFNCKTKTNRHEVQKCSILCELHSTNLILTWVNLGNDSSRRLAVSLTQSLMVLCFSSASVAFWQNCSPWSELSSDKRFAMTHKRAIKGRCSAIDSLRPWKNKRTKR